MKQLFYLILPFLLLACVQTPAFQVGEVVFPPAMIPDEANPNPDRIGTDSDPDEEWLLTESPLLMTDVLNIAQRRNPTLQSAGERWKSVQERPRQARTLEDPMLQTRQVTEPDQTKTGAMLSKKFHWFGKLELAGQVAEIETGVAEQEVLQEKWRLVAQTKIAYYDLFLINQSLQINREVKEILANIEKIAQLQYATGKVTQSDVLKTQIELARLTNDIITLEQMKTTARAALNRHLNRPSEAPLGEPGPFIPLPLKLTQKRLTELAVQYSPEIKIAEREIQLERTRVGLAQKQFYPDFVISGEYNNISNGVRDKEWAGGVGINLPLWRGKYRSAVRETEASQRASEQNYQALINKTALEIKEIYVKVTTAWRTMELYEKTLLPQAEQSLATSQVAYQTGQSDFLNLLDSVRLLLELKLGFYQAQVGYKKALAELEFCCAFPVEEVTD
ncbi:MAG: TolC family protein [Planctomycetota bacterium]